MTTRNKQIKNSKHKFRNKEYAQVAQLSEIRKENDGQKMIIHRGELHIIHKKMIR